MNIFGSKKLPHKPAQPAHIERADTMHVIVNDPFLDWMIIIVLAFVTVIALVALGAYVYVGTAARLSAAPPTVPRIDMSRINTKALGDVLEEFDGRAAERALPAKAFIAPKDPSLP